MRPAASCGERSWSRGQRAAGGDRRRIEPVAGGVGRRRNRHYETYADGLAKLGRGTTMPATRPSMGRGFPRRPYPRYRLGRIHQRLRSEGIRRGIPQSHGPGSPVLFGSLQLGPPAGRTAGHAEALPFSALEMPHPSPVRSEWQLPEALGKEDEAGGYSKRQSRPTSRREWHFVPGGRRSRRSAGGRVELGALYSRWANMGKRSPSLRKAVEHDPRDRWPDSDGRRGAASGRGKKPNSSRRSCKPRKAVEDAFPLYQRVELHPEDLQSRFKLGASCSTTSRNAWGSSSARRVDLAPDHEPTRRLLAEYENKSKARGWRLSAEPHLPRLVSADTKQVGTPARKGPYGVSDPESRCTTCRCCDLSK